MIRISQHRLNSLFLTCREICVIVIESHSYSLLVEEYASNLKRIMHAYFTENLRPDAVSYLICTVCNFALRLPASFGRHDYPNKSFNPISVNRKVRVRCKKWPMQLYPYKCDDNCWPLCSLRVEQKLGFSNAHQKFSQNMTRGWEREVEGLVLRINALMDCMMH